MNTAVFIVLVVVIVLVFILVISLFWPKKPYCNPNKPSQAGGNSPPVNDKYAQEDLSFDTVHSDLGKNMYNLIDYMGTENQGLARAEIASCVRKLSLMVCDSSKADQFVSAYEKKINALVKYSSISVSTLPRHPEDHTLTGTHSDVSGMSPREIQRELKRLEVELNLQSTNVAEAYHHCLMVEIDDLVKILNIFDGSLLNYLRLSKLENRQKEAEISKEKHLLLWNKIHLS